jgi:glutamate 5-kinase
MAKRRIVVKVGSSTLTGGTSRLSRRNMLGIAQQIVQLRELGHEVILVSSGAQVAGREHLGIATSQRPKKAAALMPYKQMLAAVGQSRLMMAWEQVFGMFDVKVAQVLLTRADLGDRHRYLNAREALMAILAHDIVPIINENDAVVTDEIRVGDNDNLSALVTNVINADLLIIITDQDGLFTADPRKDPSATLISEIEEINDDVRRVAGVSISGLGVGGMSTKLQAAELATKSGATVVLASGSRQFVLRDIVNGETVGTRFLPHNNELESRKRWILAEKPAGVIVVDEGAAKALSAGKSLLPVGVRGVQGEFERGAIVMVQRDAGKEAPLRTLGHGICRYNSTDARRVMGKKTGEIASLMGIDFVPMLIHADDMVIL